LVIKIIWIVRRIEPWQANAVKAEILDLQQVAADVRTRGRGA
jgi:hypothetical protein